MAKLTKGFGLIALLANCQMTLAQKPTQPVQKDPKQEDKKEDGKKVKKVPGKFNVELGYNWTDGQSKIDKNLPSQPKAAIAAGARFLSDSAQIKSSFQWEPRSVKANSFEAELGNSMAKLKGFFVGPALYYFKAEEHILFIKDRGLTADDWTQKDYLFVGADFRYGHINQPNIGMVYSLGTIYVREHGVFHFSNSGEKIKKLFNGDIQPSDMITINGAWPNAGIFDIEGTFRLIQTRGILGYKNTKEFIPRQHKTLTGSIKARVRKPIYVSVIGKLSDSGYGAIYLGNSMG